MTGLVKFFVNGSNGMSCLVDRKQKLLAINSVFTTNFLNEWNSFLVSAVGVDQIIMSVQAKFRELRMIYFSNRS